MNRRKQCPKCRRTTACWGSRLRKLDLTKEADGKALAEGAR
jgi:hypothetical protein